MEQMDLSKMSNEEIKKLEEKLKLELMGYQDEKVLLEEIYDKWCRRGDLDYLLTGGDNEKEFYTMMDLFIKFRLKISGGRETSMSVGMGSIGGFIDELILFDDLMTDWVGQYRGDFKWECLESLIEIMEEMDVNEELKNDIIKVYKEKRNMNEE